MRSNVNGIVRAAVCVLLLCGASQRAFAQPALPIGFVDEVVTGGFTFPTAYTTLPDGRLLVTQKSGLVRVVTNTNQLLPTPFIDISAWVNDYWDHGLLGIAADPNFATNHFVYLLYTYENDPTDYAGAKTGRLTRVTAVGDVASLASAVTILGTSVGDTVMHSCNDFPAGADCIPSENPSHSVGSVKAAADGTLFVTLGDGASFNVVDEDALRSQDINSLSGKMLHITTSGKGVSTNPFWNGDQDANRSKVWAYGLRNPYRFSLAPVTDVPYVGDVGWSTWEEINGPVPAGANFGWPCYEGMFRQPGYEPMDTCQALYAAGTARLPTVAYSHNGVGAAATGGLIYPGSAFPPMYQGAYFYTDYANGFIRYFQLDGTGQRTGAVSGFAVGLDSPVYLDSDGQNLLYVSILAGEIHRIRNISASSSTSYISDRAWTFQSNSWGPVERDQSNGETAADDGLALNINGQKYAKGLGTNAPAEVRLAIGGSCSVFAASVGMDEEVTAGTVVFQVWADGTKIYDSGVMTGSTAVKSINVNVAGKSDLRLIVTDGGDGPASDHADWGNARLTCTTPDVTAPTVSSVSPAAGSTGVAVGVNVTATFSEAMDATSLSATTVTLKQGGNAVAAAVTYDAVSHSVTLDPTANLTGGLVYTATIKSGASGVKDAAGNPLASDMVWSFTTLPADTTPPTVTAVNPANGALGLPVTINITASFSEAMNASTISGTTVTLKQGATAVPAAISYDAATLTVTIDPTANLAVSTPYTVTITGPGGVKDLAGNAMAADRIWSFTTGASVVTSYLSDWTWTFMANGWGPVELDHSNGEDGDGDGATLTLNGATYTKGLGTHAPSEVRYNLAAGCSIVTALVGVDDEIGANGSVIFQVWADGVKRYDSGLMTGATATRNVNVDVGGVSVLSLIVTDGGDGVAADHGDWANAQVSCSDTTAPTVTATTPAPGATDVASSINATATFSETMNAATVSGSTVTLKQGSTTVPATVSYDANTRVVTIDPTADLATNTTYTATVRSGSTGVKDLAGNPLAADKTWSFTTAVSPGVTTYLSDRTWTTMTNGWGPVERDQSNGEDGTGDGRVLTLNGVTYAKGLGTHAPSDVRYALAGCSILTALVGIDDEAAAGSVVFQVWADGVKRYDSGVMNGATATKTVNVDLSGAAQLALIVTDGGDGIGSDHGDWANAQLTCHDTIAPTVTSTVPAAGATGIAAAANLTALFSEAMDPATVSGTTVTLTQGATSVPATVTYDVTTRTVTIDPTANLAAGTTYTATIKGPGGVEDLAGNALAADKVWSFTTNKVPNPTIAQPLPTFKFKVGDIIAYSGSATDPEDGTLPGTSLRWDVLLFHCPGGVCHTHPLQNGTGTSGSFTAPDHGDDSYFQITLTATDSGGVTGVATVAIHPQEIQLTLDTVPSGLQVVYGGATATAPATFTTIVGSAHTILAPSPQGALVFNSWSDGGAAQHNVVANTNVTYVATFSGTDTIAPTVTSVTPVNNATGVPPTANATAAFSEAMDAATLTATTVTLKQGATIVAAAITYDAASKTVTIDPTATLATNTTYTATVKGPGGAKDVAGNAMAADRVWSFTTAGSAGVSSYLSDLSWTSMTNGFGPVERDHSNGEDGSGDGGVLTLNGVTYAKGLGTHASSTVRFALGGACSILTASVGVDDEVGANGSVVFQVWTDGLQRYDSGLMTGSTATKSVNLDITGSGELMLVVTDGGNGIGADHADWANAQVTCSDTVAPTVTATSPSAGATGVALTVNASATFSEPMDPTTVTGATVTLQQGATAIPATVTYDAASRTVIIDPTGTLDPNVSYTATVKGPGGAKDTAGNAMAADKVWSFTTAGSAGAASYLSDRTWSSMTNGWGPVERDRSNGENGAGDGKTLTLNGVTYAKGLGGHAASDVRFALGGACGLLTASIGVDDEVAGGSVVFQVWTDGTKRYDSGLMIGTTATKSINVDIAGATELALIVTDGGDGNGADHADWANAQVTCSDSVPPTVTATSPAAGATGVAVSTNPTATFSEAMDATAVSATTVGLTQGGAAVPATVTYDASTRTVSIAPSASLATTTTYTATILGGSGGVKDAAGNALVANKSWSFTTAAAGASTSYVSDRTWTTMTNAWGPVERDKSNGENGTGDGNTLTLNGVTYAKGLGTHASSDVRYALGGVCSLFTASIGIDDEAAAGSVVFQVWTDGVKRYDSGLMIGTTATKNISVDISSASELALIVTDSGDGIGSDHGDWANAQVSCTDTTAPTVSSTTPAAGATGFAVAANITAVFSEAMDPATITATTVTLKRGAVQVAAAVTYAAGTRTVTIDPTANLVAATVYTVTIKGPGGVKDLTGNAMAADKIWTFTTQ